MTAEIWNPITKQFTSYEDMTVPRNYHSVALLLQDGRVMAAGSGLCGGCATNHADMEIFTPPYLRDSNGQVLGRPTIVSAPKNATRGQTITVTLNSTAEHSFSLVRTASATHSINTDQRRIPVSAIQRGQNFSISLSANASILVPGNYFLFAMNSDGVPSVASVINIQ